MSEPQGTAEAVVDASSQPVWYYASAGQQRGPVSDADLAQLCASGEVRPDTLVWRQGFVNWIPFSQVHANIPMGAPLVQPGVVLTYFQQQEDPTNIFGWWWQVISRDYANFRGRARRKEFWSFLLVQILMVFALVVLVILLGSDRGRSAVGAVLITLMVIVWLGSVIPYLAVVVRRLHDTGRGGVWFLISFIPYVGGLILLILLAQDSEQGTNQYGPNPKSALRERV